MKAPGDGVRRRTAAAPRTRSRRRAKTPRGAGARPFPLGLACLGSSAAVPSDSRDTTALVIRAGGSICLVDVGGSPVQKLRRVAVDPLDLTAVVVTHTHPDHVYGLPALVQSLRILGRTAPLPVYCPGEHVEKLVALLDLFDLLGRAESLEVPVIGVEPAEGVELFATDDLTVTASPNAHGRMPNLAVRVAAGARSVVYSSDTRPCPAVVTLARDASILVHEATLTHPDPTQWHSTARQAGEIARQAGVRRLLLAHVGHLHHDATPALVAEAHVAFRGPVAVADELRWYRA